MTRPTIAEINPNPVVRHEMSDRELKWWIIGTLAVIYILSCIKDLLRQL